ncbi:MAG TPA: DPP IV N-terminal domain-containing protein [Sphingomonas sp.]|uniref:S9 family peptidase n=1 Tax=Sphingomonas sp. TaxID=28214 RepID=UPI002C4D3FFD|nr:DPP IV N-terminal domain-containing protein [Sphingomonas sp.]HMI20533.1 DPP IV N-terminal domain-containing protein [Sphingomonas sp.]
MLAALALTFVVAPAAAEQLTLERIFASPSLDGPAPRKVRLSPDGSLATLLRNRPDDRDRYDLWGIDTKTGQARMLVDSAKIGSGGEISEAEKMRRERARVGGTKGIVDYEWAPDGKSVLVPIDGDLYLAGLDGKVRRLTDTPQSEIDAHVSRGGHYVSFVRDQNLFANDLATGAERQLTKDGSGTITCGTAEFVAQEEMDRFTGHWWAPGDKAVAVECYDEAQVKIVTRAAIGTDGTRTFEQRYPAAGTPNVAVSLYVVAPDGGSRVKVDLGPSADIYLARVNWAPDGRTLYVQRLSRDQKTLDLLAADPATGASHVLLSETSPTWVNLNYDFRALRDGSLIWGSERSGSKHLYRFVSGKWTQLTHGDWTLETDAQSHPTGLIGVDEKSHRLFFAANKDDLLESQVYAVDYLHPGEPRRLTERGYWNEAEMDGAGTRLLVTRSSPTQPSQVYLADAAGKRIAWIAENKLDASHPYAPYLAMHRPVTYGTIQTADGATLHYEMITPPLEPGKHYPVFFEHYGGPHLQQVKRSWMGALPQYWVSKGWIYFAIDNRGSANRGHAFEAPLYHAMGGVEVADQAAGARWLQTQPFVDPKRIATFGWSYGGYMTLKMLQANPGLYAAGIAGAPVTKWEFYDTAYTERYLGMPPYTASDTIADAAKISDPLLMLHGMADDNVVFENSTVMYGALQQAGARFEMMAYPGQTHGFNTRASLHRWKTIEDFLDRRVKNAPDK